MSQENVEIVRHAFEAWYPNEQQPAFLCELRDGKIMRITEYRTKADALEAAGLAE